MFVDVRPLDERIKDSSLPQEKKDTLLALYRNTPIVDIKEQAFELLFNRENSLKYIGPSECKMMMIEFMRLLAYDEVRARIRRDEVEPHLDRLQALFNFFDTLDCHSFDMLQDIEHILDYGEDEPDPQRPGRYLMTVEGIFELYRPDRYQLQRDQEAV